MAFKKRAKAGNDKYLRLTGLWQSKNNDSLWTGRLKAEQVADLLAKVEEAAEGDCPIVFSLWENDKKESKRDPEFSLQCFVGDSEESPRSNRSSKSSGSSRRAKPDEEEEEDDSNEEEEDNDEEEDEQEDKPSRKKSTRKGTEGKSGKKRDSSW